MQMRMGKWREAPKETEGLGPGQKESVPEVSRCPSILTESTGEECDGVRPICD